MYSDIIPPKKNNSIRNISLERFDELEPIAEQPYRPGKHPGHDRSFPKFFLFLVLGVLVVGGVVYAKFIERTTLTFLSKTTTLDIREKFPAMVQKDDVVAPDGTVYYNLVYISGKEKRENPFVPVVKSATSTNKTFTDADLKPVTAVSTSTNSTTTVYLVNETGESIPLRATTRIDIGGTIYSLPSSVTVSATKNASIFAKKQKYYLPGFKGTPAYNSLYAVKTDGPLDIPEKTTTTGTTTQSVAVASTDSTTVPEDIISLLPKTNIALKKHTIYDQIADQPAVVVFNKQELLKVIEKKNPGLQDYMKAFKPLSDVVEFDIDISDYDLDVSPETGRPVTIKRIVLEIKPLFKTDEIKKAFAHFNVDTMEKIRVQLGDFSSVQVKNTPFWSREVAEEGKVEVIIEEN